MTTPAIRIENLGKQYRIGSPGSGGNGSGGGGVPGGHFRYKSLRDSLVNTAKRPWSVVTENRKLTEDNSFWALKDINFEVQPGEVVGIIGRNGAGKSTLLKILSRITKPTTGHVELRGRVGSLLEVGTGFHPELTGRENIFLNGAILGMTRAEVRKKFDEIVAFSEIERLLDTPVKQYSSGMYTRLAFAVAAHLDPEILVVDEVLAVGDAAFQKKCLGKMKDVAGEGRTVLFVSHNMSTLMRLCGGGILLDEGKLVTKGSAHHVVTHYLDSGLESPSERIWKDMRSAPGNEVARLNAIRVRSDSGQATDTVEANERVGIEMVYEVLQEGHLLVPNFHFFSSDGTYLFVTQDFNEEWTGQFRPAGQYTSTAWIPPNLLAEGAVIVGAALSTFSPMQIHFYERDAIKFHVVEAKRGVSARGHYHGHLPGVIRPLLEWDTKTVKRI